MLTPSERRLRSRIAAHALHARYDSRALTEKARAAADARFYAGIPEDLPAAERDRRAAHARAEHFARLAFLSAKARRRASAPKCITTSEETA